MKARQFEVSPQFYLSSLLRNFNNKTNIYVNKSTTNPVTGTVQIHILCMLIKYKSPIIPD